jgi:hypothetical protein
MRAHYLGMLIISFMICAVFFITNILDYIYTGRITGFGVIMQCLFLAAAFFFYFKWKHSPKDY